MTIRQFGLFIAMLWSGLGFAQAELRYNASLAVTSEALELNAPIAVDFEVEGVSDGACLYVPAHDQKLRQTLLLESIKATSPQETAGRSDLSFDWVDKTGLEHIGPALYRINKPQAGKLKLKYLLGLSGWADREKAPKLLNLWHPIYLKNCPAVGEQSFVSVWPKAEFQVKFPTPAGWQLAAPGELHGSTRAYEGTSFSAVFYKVGKQFSYQLGDIKLITVSKSEGFENLIGVAKAALVKYAKLTGVIPEPTMLLVETDDFEPLRNPGIVTLNTPQQPGMRYLQQELTNWFVWQVSLHFAQQWFGLHCKSATTDDHWLMQSLADTLVYSLVVNERDYFEFFARGKNGKPYLNLNYRQAQDLAAASMSLLHPQSSLLDENGASRPPSVDKPFISYIRGSQMFRYLQWKLGNREFQTFVQELTTQCAEEGLRPKRIADLVNKHRDGLGALVLKYWASDDWPEVSLNGTEERDGVTYLKVHYDNDLLMPIDVWVTTKDESKRVFFIEPLSQDVEIALEEQKSDIRKIEINPGRALFDKDRFNNKTGAPKLAFFPGAARGLEDDAYTIVWLPYISQLPGEPFTLNLSFQTLRYLNSGVTGSVRYQPSENRTGFSFWYLKGLPEYSLFLLAKVGQDDGHVEDGERRISLDIKRRPIFSLIPRLDFSARVKSKQMLGQKNTQHMTGGGNLSYSSESGHACGFDTEAELESTVYVPSNDFSYTRSFGRLGVGCENKVVAGRLSFFYGSSKADGNVPKTALFRLQNLDEAHVRLDKPNMGGSLRIATFNAEVATPAKLPLPESWFVLPRRSQFKAFVDGGELHDPEHNVLVSGLGYTLPVGGDIAGKDSVTLLRFSINGIFYRKIDGVEDTKPGLLFDFGGSL